jgi:hypothetical protein
MYSPPKLKIVEVLKGQAEAGQVFNVLLGRRDDGARYIAVLTTPDQHRRQYTVMMYVAGDGLRRLASFPLSQTEYDRWKEETYSYERLMSKPGVPH